MCCTHTLNLVASKDTDKFLSTSSASKAVYRNSFAKSSALWNKANRSTVASDAVQEVTQRRLIVPNATRWNSFYNAVVRVTENPLAELNELCTKLELRCFTEREFKFLKEYSAVLKPVSRGLDILQGEDNCFFGSLLPTLEAIIKKVVTLKPDLSSMTVRLAGCIEDAIRTRFQKVFNDDDAIIVAITVPKFKLKWVETQSKKDRYKQMLIQEMRLHAAGNDAVVVEETQAEKKDDFYDFQSDEESDSQGNVETEANDYLYNAKTIESLHQYPVVKRLFILHNTALPSSAPVERLFSLGGLVLTSRRNRLTDDRFEKLLLMRYNKDFLHI